MFGYVRPFRDELKLRDFDRFRAAYCGLCRTMGRRCGPLSRLLLNFDFTFLAILLAAAEEEPCCHTCRRCVMHPFSARPCAESTASLELAADESMILAWWKLKDNVQDKTALSGLPDRCAALLLRRGYRRAARCRPEFDRLTRQCLADLRELELARSPSLDRAADASARLLAAAACSVEDVSRARILDQLLYHVGRWIYLADAYHDRLRDAGAGNYNPLLLRFPDGPELGEEAREQLERTMTHSLNMAASAYHLLPEGDWSPVMENVLFLGLPAAQKAILADAWEPRQRRRPQLRKTGVFA
ncbi:MAG: hypothetical protein IKD79_06505 [Oscillospiraceae bacterium]|nr:hypothetical protein [Oscillospiraceae bacterium]